MREAQREMDEMLAAFGPDLLDFGMGRPAATAAAAALRLPYAIHETDKSYELVAEVRCPPARVGLLARAALPGMFRPRGLLVALAHPTCPPGPLPGARLQQGRHQGVAGGGQHAGGVGQQGGEGGRRRLGRGGCLPALHALRRAAGGALHASPRLSPPLHSSSHPPRAASQEEQPAAAAAKEGGEQEGGSAARRLYSSRSFYQRLRLPDNVSAEQIRASTKDGVLTVVLPKAPKAEPKRKEIPVA
jgi:hypothetical protein